MDTNKQVHTYYRPRHWQHIDNQLQHDIASQGGQASSGSFQPGDQRAREAGRKGGSRTKGDSNVSD